MKYNAISPIQLQRIVQSISDRYNLVIPTYTVEIAGGSTQIYEYDEKSIEDEKTSSEDREKWKEYKERELQMQAEISEKTTAYIVYKGIDCGEIPDEWKEEQEWLEVKLPDNKFDLKVRYIFTEVLITPQDIKDALAEIMQLSAKGVDKSAIKAAENSFPSTLQKPAREINTD